jgi:autotransporter-associated beta strand protein
MTFTGSGTRIFDIAAGSQLSIGGAVHSFNNGNLDFFGGGTLNVANGGSISLDVNSLNTNIRLGTGTGLTNTLNVNAGGTVIIPDALSGNNANRLRVGPVSGAGGIVNINNGGQIIAADNAVNETRSLIDLGQVAGATGILNLNAGGLLHAQRIEAVSVDADTTVNLNGGLLQAHKISGSTTYFSDIDRVQVQAGGAVIDTTNSVSCTVPLTEDSASPGGGLTKLGAGVLVLPAGNTYSGPTVVSNGMLSLVLPVSSSALTMRPNTTVALAVTNASWNANSVTFDGNTNTLNLDFGDGGPTVTPLLVGTLAVNGTTVINVSGSFAALGTYPLIDYTTRTGAGSLQLGTPPTQPPGTIATLVTNLGTASIDLVISDSATPVFDAPILSGGNLIWTGTGFTPNGTYSILTSTNVGAPLSTWTTNATGTFSGSGAFSQAIPAGSAAQGFFLLKTP